MHAISDTNVGGGVKLSLVGPIRLRLDHRVFTLKGDARHPKPQRFYAGLNLKFQPCRAEREGGACRTEACQREGGCSRGAGGY